MNDLNSNINGEWISRLKLNCGRWVVVSSLPVLHLYLDTTRHLEGNKRLGISKRRPKFT